MSLNTYSCEAGHILSSSCNFEASFVPAFAIVLPSVTNEAAKCPMQTQTTTDTLKVVLLSVRC